MSAQRGPEAAASFLGQGRLVLLLLALCWGAAGEALLFLRRQCAQIGSYLAEDFRLAVLVSEPISENGINILEDRLRALPIVEGVRFVSKEESLRKAEERDPGIQRAVGFLGSNPLPPSFEVKPSVEALGGLPDWLPKIRSIPNVQEVRYKTLQSDGLVQIHFYEKFIGLILDFCLSVALAASVFFLWRLSVLPTAMFRLKQSVPWILTGMGGAFLGMGLCLGIAYPLRYLSPLWVWPSVFQQFGLAAAGGLWGWVLYRGRRR